jgi:hypothetical protein
MCEGDRMHITQETEAAYWRRLRRRDNWTAAIAIAGSWAVIAVLATLVLTFI